MLTIETKELEISVELKRKADMICKFAGVKAKYQNGNVKSISNRNIAYAKPHIITIKKTDFLIFEESEYIFINGYQKRIKFSEFQEYIKRI